MLDYSCDPDILDKRRRQQVGGTSGRIPPFGVAHSLGGPIYNSLSGRMQRDDQMSAIVQLATLLCVLLHDTLRDLAVH